MGRDEARERAYHERDNQTHGRTRATNRYPKKDNEIGDVLLKVENLGSEYTNLRDVSFEANRGRYSVSPDLTDRAEQSFLNRSSA